MRRQSVRAFLAWVLTRRRRRSGMSLKLLKELNNTIIEMLCKLIAIPKLLDKILQPKILVMHRS